MGGDARIDTWSGRAGKVVMVVVDTESGDGGNTVTIAHIVADMALTAQERTYVRT